MDHLVWFSADAARERVQDYCQEVQRHEHLHTRLGREFDLLDHLQAIVTDWHSLGPDEEASKVVQDLVAVGWGRPFTDVRPRLDVFLTKVAQRPRVWFKILTHIQDRTGTVLEVVGRTLLSRQAALDDRAYEQRGAADIGLVIADFLDLHDRTMYEFFRDELLAFCLDEAISPEAVAVFVQDRPDYWLTADEHLSQTITADLPLHCTWLAHRLFWA